MKQVLGGPRTVVGIEDNKPEAIEAMKAAIARLQAKSAAYNGIEVMVLKKKYPQGGEKQLIDAVARRQVKSMGLPIDVGAVVQNVATSLAVYDAVMKNRPLTTNTLTVTGDCLPADRQKNYLFRIGVPFSFIIEQSGGMPEDAVKVISGGPMMGKAISNLDATTVKGSSSILYLTAEQTVRKPESNCIRCGKCVEACPMGLEPYLLNKLARNGMMDELEQNAIQDCIECGCCLYSCPANIPLLDVIRIAKGLKQDNNEQTVIGFTCTSPAYEDIHNVSDAGCGDRPAPDCHCLHPLLWLEGDNDSGSERDFLCPSGISHHEISPQETEYHRGLVGGSDRCPACAEPPCDFSVVDGAHRCHCGYRSG